MRRPLPSWTDGPASEAIIHFVRRVTNPSSPAYVPPEERIAVFDSDGTLWCEQPASALALFVMYRLRDPLAARLDGLDACLIEAARAGDLAAFQALDLHRLSEILLRTNAGLTPEQFVAQARTFLGRTPHPRFGVPFGRLTYRPMLELLAFLQGKEFRPFIVTGGSVEFVRAASEELYGVPGERVAGAAVDYAFERLDGKVLVIRTLTLLGEPGEGEAKVRAIEQRIGRRPILAAGNSLGDREMLEYTGSGDHPSLCLAIEHDDPLREYAYPPSGSPLREIAERSGWVVVSMRRDFRRVFARLAPERTEVLTDVPGPPLSTW